MKKTYLLIFIIALISMASKCVMDFAINFTLKNKSNYTIYWYDSSKDISGGVYPDTAINFDREEIKYITKPNEVFCLYIQEYDYKRWISRFPKDTVSIYIFNKDTLDAYKWEIIQSDYKILQRYDLSLEDIYALKENNIPVITYPPDERMKHMKMYPSYE
jgi:hypothetical protein